MPRGIAKRFRRVGPISAQLEEFFPINYQVLGRPEWIRDAFEEDALLASQIVYISDAKELSEPIEWLKRQPEHTIDTETGGPGKKGGLEPRNPESRILLFQIGTAERVLLVDPYLIPEFREVLESDEWLHILQNAVFDFEFILSKYNIHLGRMLCTMLQEQLLTAGRSGIGVGMEDIVRRYYPHRLITKELRKLFGNIERFTRKMVYYGARDVAVLPPVRAAQAKELSRFHMTDVSALENDIIPCTAMMELGGVPFDCRVLGLALTWWKQREAMLADRIIRMYDEEVGKQGEKSLFLIEGMREVFDLNSAGQKLAALKRLGVEVEDTRRDTLEGINTPFTKLLVEYSEVAKIVSTYGDSLIARVDQATGCLYPEFNQLGSGDLDAARGRVKKTSIATGRYSGDFQQLPRSEPRFSVVNDPLLLAQVRNQFRDAIAETMQEVVLQ